MPKVSLYPDVLSEYLNSENAEYAVVLEEFAGWYELRQSVIVAKLFYVFYQMQELQFINRVQLWLSIFSIGWM